MLSSIENTSTKRLNKRGTLEDLWNTVPVANKVNTGAAKSWELYPDQGKLAAVYAPTEFYGCTLVVIVNGHGIIIGHFAQEKPGNVICLEDHASVNKMMGTLETAEAGVDVDGHADTRAWIIYSDDTSTTSPGYKAIMENLTDEELMNIPTANIAPVPYRRGGGGGVSDKLVVQWSPDGTGATLNVYIRSDTATFTGTYDCNGNPVSGSKLKARASACAPAGTFVTSTSAPAPSTSAPAPSTSAPAPSNTPTPSPSPPPFAPGLCSFHLTETQDCDSDYGNNLYGNIVLKDNNKNIIAQSVIDDDHPIGYAMDDGNPYTFTSVLPNPLVITGEHENDYVQFTYGGLSWQSKAPNGGATCSVGGWDPRDGPVCDDFLGFTENAVCDASYISLFYLLTM